MCFRKYSEGSSGGSTISDQSRLIKEKHSVPEHPDEDPGNPKGGNPQDSSIAVYDAQKGGAHNHMKNLGNVSVKKE